MKIRSFSAQIARSIVTVMLLSLITSTAVTTSAVATTGSKIWFKSKGTNGSVRPASEPSGSLVREGTFNSLEVGATSIETLTVTCSTGTNPHWNAPYDPTEVIIDSTNGKMYWHNSFEPGIVKSNLDGTSCERIVQDDYYKARGIALDSAGQYLYVIYINTIRKVDIAGNSESALTITGDSFTASDRLEDIVIDGSTMYVSTNTSSANSGRIVKININTLVATNLITAAPNGIKQVALDTSNSKIYWANATAKTLSSATLSDGSNIQTLRSSAKAIAAVAVDTANSKLYIGEIDTGAGAVVKTDLDGSNAVSTGVVTGTYLTVVPGSAGGGGGTGGGGSSDSDADRKEAERKRQAEIDNCRISLKSALAGNQKVEAGTFAKCGYRPLTTPSEATVVSKLLVLSVESRTSDFVLNNLVTKIGTYEDLQGSSARLVTGLQLAQTGIIPAGTLYKTVITLRLINLEPTARDSIEEIDAFISGEAKKMQARKEHLAAIIAKINAGK